MSPDKSLKIKIVQGVLKSCIVTSSVRFAGERVPTSGVGGGGVRGDGGRRHPAAAGQAAAGKDALGAAAARRSRTAAADAAAAAPQCTSLLAGSDQEDGTLYP